MFDNLYYVGPCYVSVWLLTTPQGHVLFDSAQEPFVDHVIANIQKVGINLRDIKYIILSHGHLDHVGGAARLQERDRRARGGGGRRLDDDRSAPGQVEQAATPAPNVHAEARHGGEGRRYADARRSDAEIPSARPATRPAC